MATSARLALFTLASWVLACFSWAVLCSSAVAAGDDDYLVGVLSLANDPAVAKELGLSEDVQKQLADYINKRIDDGLQFSLDIKDLEPAERTAKLAPFVAESEKDGLKLLTAEQQAKLKQIRVRRVGPTVLLEEGLADQLELTARQRGQLATLNGFFVQNTAAIPEAEKARAKIELEKQILDLLTPEQKTQWEALEGRTGGQVAQAAPADPAVPVKPELRNSLIPAGPGPAPNGRPAPGTRTAPNANPGSSTATLKPARDPLKAGTPNDKLKFQFTYAPWKEVINWFAEQADFSLVAETFPQGTFNYTDNTRTYTPGQALDLLNKVLITKGYRLLRHERMLFLLSSDDDLPDGFATRVEEDELDTLGSFDIVQCQFQLSKVTAEEAETEIKKLITLQGKIIVLSRAKQVVVTDTAGALKQVRKTIKALENPVAKNETVTIVKLDNIRPGEFMTILRDVVGIPPALNAMPDGSLRISVDELGMRLIVTGTLEKLEKVNELKAAIDIPAASSVAEGPGVLEQPQIVVYSVHSADPESVLAVLQNVLAGIPEVRIARDPKNGNIIAHCRPAQHATIQALLDEMQKDATQFTVFKLFKNDPQSVALQINELFGTDKGAGGPKIVADTTNLAISVRGSPAQILQIEALLKKMGELGGGSVAGAPGAARTNFRVIGNVSNRTALSAVDQINQMWNLNARPNHLIIHKPRPKNAAAELQNNVRPVPATTPGQNGPMRSIEEFDTAPAPGTSSRSNGARLRPLGGEPEPAIDPDRQRVIDETGVDPGDLRGPRTAPPAAPDAPAPPPPAQPHLEPAAPPAKKLTEPTAQRSANSRMQFVSQPLPATATDSNPESTEEPATEEAPVDPPGPKTRPGADVVISLGPAGIIIASDDLDALDQIEHELRAIVELSNAKGREFHIMYLRHAKAPVVATLLQELLSGAPSTDTGGGGGSLMGDLAQGMMGDMGGGLLGGLLGFGGGGGGGSAVTAGSAQITSDIRLNALYIRANARDLELIEDFIEVIDQPENPEGMQMTPKPRFIPVKYSTADAIAAVVRQVYSNRLTADANSGAQRQPSPQDFIQALRGGGRGGQQQQNKGEELKMTVGVDTRTNSLIVAAPDYLFNEVKALVEQLDVSELASDQIVRVVSLKSANADVITRSVQSLYGDKIAVTKTATTGTTGTRPGGTQQPPRTGGQGGQGQGGGNRGGQGGGQPQQQQQGPNMQDLMNAMQRGGGGGGGFPGGGGGGFPGGGGGRGGGGGFGGGGGRGGR